MSVAQTVTVEIREDGSKKYIVKKLGEIKKKTVYNLIKRVLDLVFSFLALVVLVIPMLLLSLVVLINSEGPALYKQERVGLNGKRFTLYKFRSMRMDAESNGAQWAVDDDPRVTKVGRFMRMTRLDELPQLLNILKGDMSFVGPRPERPVFYEKFAEYIDGFDERLKVKPGLTGLAQISGGYNLKPEEKVAYDIEYIETRSLWLDFKLVFETVAVVFTHDGAK